MKIHNGFPLLCNQGWKEAFWQQAKPQSDSEVMFSISLLCLKCTFRRSSWCFNTGWGRGDPVPPTHNKGRKKGEREQLGFKGCKCSVPLRASLLSSGIPVFTHHSKAVAPQPSTALLAEHPHCHLLGAHLWNTATKGAASSNGPSGGQKGLRKASSYTSPPLVHLLVGSAIFFSDKVHNVQCTDGFD